MRRVLAAVAVLFACTATPARAATHDVGIANFAFHNGTCPAPTGDNVAVISVGGTARWTNCDGVTHDVTWKQPGLTQRTLGTGDSASQTFSTPGAFDYYCSIHGSINSQNMQGKVRVQPTPTTRPPDPVAPTTTIARPTTTTTAAPAPGGATIGTAPTTGVTTESTTTTSTTEPDTTPIADKDGGANGAVVALTLVAIGVVVGGGVYVIRRMRSA